jgi:hypothetical protein
MEAQSLRRAFATEEGERLLLARSAYAMAVKYDEMKEATKLPDEAIISDAICSVPMPRYEPEFTGEGNRWPGVRTSMMWHPHSGSPSLLTVTSDSPGRPRSDSETDAMWMVELP